MMSPTRTTLRRTSTGIHLEAERALRVGVEDPPDALCRPDGHRALLYHDLAAGGDVGDAPCARLNVLQVCSPSLTNPKGLRWRVHLVVNIVGQVTQGLVILLNHLLLDIKRNQLRYLLYVLSLLPRL